MYISHPRVIGTTGRTGLLGQFMTLSQVVRHDMETSKGQQPQVHRVCFCLFVVQMIVSLNRRMSYQCRKVHSGAGTVYPEE